MDKAKLVAHTERQTHIQGYTDRQTDTRTHSHTHTHTHTHKQPHSTVKKQTRSFNSQMLETHSKTQTHSQIPDCRCAAYIKSTKSEGKNVKHRKQIGCMQKQSCTRKALTLSEGEPSRYRRPLSVRRPLPSTVRERR